MARIESGVPQAALNEPDVGSVEPRFMGKVLLGQLSCEALLAEDLGKRGGEALAAHVGPEPVAERLKSLQTIVTRGGAMGPPTWAPRGRALVGNHAHALISARPLMDTERAALGDGLNVP